MIVDSKVQDKQRIRDEFTHRKDQIIKGMLGGSLLVTASGADCIHFSVLNER